MQFLPEGIAFFFKSAVNSKYTPKFSTVNLLPGILVTVLATLQIHNSEDF